jgi:eukaryotic-like serine/threonine-protein kinase
MAKKRALRDPSESAGDPEKIAELIEKCRLGDAAATEVVFARYVNRLTGLARTRLSRKLAARFDPADVVMSAYRSFFIGLREHGFVIAEEAELWQLLVQITLRKLYRQAARHRGAKRDASREVHNSVGAGSIPSLAGREPRPEEAVAIAEEVELLLGQLSPSGRRIVELRLQGQELSEIAREIEVNERTVRRWLDRAKEYLHSRRGPRGSAGSRTSPAAKLPRTVRDPGNVDARLSERPIKRGRSPGTTIPAMVPVVEYSDFVLRRMIGMGASGKVYRATRSDGRAYAIKFLRKAFIADRAAIDRFVAELSLVAGLKHPNIMPVLGGGRTPAGGYFFVMDLADSDLQRRIDRGRIAVGQSLEWLRQAAAGVHFAHKQGIIHCDLKPSNLLLSRGSNVIVSDFGLACRAEQMVCNRRLAGTPAFMAPEQIVGSGKGISPTTDIYGLGATLYALLTGRPPFTGNRLSEVLAQVVSAAAPIPPSQIRRGLAKDVEQLCLRCLAKKPADRYPSASALLRALEQCKL